MSNPFAPATKKKARLRLALFGPSGSGKTYTALEIARGIGGKVAVLDTEHGSASKYADLFTFDALELSNFHPRHYIAAIAAAVANGYDVLIIDSLTHAWSGTGGVLEIVDNASARSKGNSYVAWREGTPLHMALIEAVLGAHIHIIATMRSKTEYVLETGKNGKTQPRKIGLAPVQRDGMEYEFDVVGEMNMDHQLIVSKSRCAALADAVIDQPGAQVAETLTAWLSDGVEETAQEPEAPADQPARSTPRQSAPAQPRASKPASKASADAEPPAYDLLTDPREFEPDMWAGGMCKAFVDAKLADNMHHASKRLRLIYDLAHDAPYEYVIEAQKEARYTVAVLAQMFKSRQNMRDVEVKAAESEG